MMTNIAIVTEDFDTADALLAALDPASIRWNPDARDWVFRGHGDACWKLVPTALRNERWLESLNEGERRDASHGAPLRSQLMSTGEWQAVVAFMNAADRAGLAIPEDAQDLRNSAEHARLVSREDFDVSTWPPNRFLSVVAMAQHYGVPTRLLDWSWRPLTAAYFCAKQACALSAPTSTEMAVWALRTRFVTFAWSKESRRVQLVTAPQASNRNLAAQAGLFTLDRDAVDETCFSDILKRKYDESGGTFFTTIGPAMRKLCLPRSEAPKVLRLLAMHGVTAATVFPGYSGVVESLRERGLWDFVPHPSTHR